MDYEQKSSEESGATNIGQYDLTEDDQFEYISCNRCDVPVFREKTEAWRSYCKPCYIETVRHCLNCNGAMSISAKSWQKVCGKCYLEAKKTTHVVCPTCIGEDALKLSMPSGATSCRACKEKKFRFNNRPGLKVTFMTKDIQTDSTKRFKTA